MEKILEEIGKWLLEAEGDLADSLDATEKDFHKGEVSAFKKVGVLLQRLLTTQSSKKEFSCSCSAVKRIEVGKFCPDCGGRNSRR